MKGSTTFFIDTGLMAIMCRHDHVLYYVNMHTAGESHFYAYALIDACQKELPSTWLIGIMYDIACQTHRSCNKWEWFPDLLPRLRFAVSVFHAYGHDWVCQLHYHPRKQEIWGLTDGKSNERLWSDLRKLIPSLRVTGHYRRLFMLDLQLEHRHKVKLPASAKWLADRVKNTVKTRAAAQALLNSTAKSVEHLCHQWEAQREYQSEPLSKHATGSGRKAVQKIIDLRQSNELLQETIIEMKDELAEMEDEENENDFWRLELLDDLAEKEALYSGVATQLKHMLQELRLTDQVSANELDELRKSEWFNHVIGMRALKTRLIAALRKRQFQVANLSRASRAAPMGE